MKIEAILKYYLCNGSMYSINEKEPFLKIVDPVVYEVIRVIDGVPLFLEEHLERMRKSAELTDVKISYSDQEIEKDIKLLIKENDVKNLNVKLLFDSSANYFVFFINSYYPEKEVYEKGIHTILYNSERKNPNAKVINVSFKDQVNKKIKEEGAFEALLVNKEGYITEGSRSNMFFVKGQKVFTAPAGEVLMGVTRKHIMNICDKLGIEVIERNISVNELKYLDGAFMTGTSVNVLPISSIDKLKYDSVVNEIINKIQKEYIKDLNEYIELKKN